MKAVTVRTRSQTHHVVGKQLANNNSGNTYNNIPKGKRSKKRTSDVGPSKPHQYATRNNPRTALGEININNPTGASVQGLGPKRQRGAIHRKRTSGESLQVCQQPIPPVPSSNVGKDNLNYLKSSLKCSIPPEFEMDLDMDTSSDCDDDERQQMKKDEQELLKIDAADIGNPQAVCEYIQDIMLYYKDAESRRAPKSAYMDSQRDINAKMREILVDWLSEVHLKFKLRPETMYLTVNLIDRFLSLRAVSRTKLQLVGCTAMLIASKYEEIYAPEVRDFVYISDKAYTRDQILMMESIMLNTLQFNLTVPSALRFGQRFIKMVPNKKTRFSVLVSYLMELTLQNYDFLDYLPSMIAASATYLALSMTADKPGNPKWSSLLKSNTTYREEELQNCVRDLYALAAKKPEKYRAVRKKYSSRKFLEVAKISVGPPLWGVAKNKNIS